MDRFEEGHEGLPLCFNQRGIAGDFKKPGIALVHDGGDDAALRPAFAGGRGIAAEIDQGGGLAVDFDVPGDHADFGLRNGAQADLAAPAVDIHEGAADIAGKGGDRNIDGLAVGRVDEEAAAAHLGRGTGRPAFGNRPIRVTGGGDGTGREGLRGHGSGHDGRGGRDVYRFEQFEKIVALFGNDLGIAGHVEEPEAVGTGMQGGGYRPGVLMRVFALEGDELEALAGQGEVFGVGGFAVGLQFPGEVTDELLGVGGFEGEIDDDDFGRLTVTLHLEVAAAHLMGTEVLPAFRELPGDGGLSGLGRRSHGGHGLGRSVSLLGNFVIGHLMALTAGKTGEGQERK